MPSKQDYLETMRLKTNTQLLIILKSRVAYNTLAIEAVNEVLAERELSPEETEDELVFIAKLEKEKTERAEEPLADILKIKNFLLPISGLIQLVSLDKADGYDRKVNDANFWAKRGCLFYLAIFCILFIMAGYS
jgi:hypothetical protein